MGRYRRARAEPQPVAGPEPCHIWTWIASAHLIGLAPARSGCYAAEACVAMPIAARAVETVVVAACPAVTDAEVGLSEIEKSLLTAAVTVSEKVVVCVAELPVPVIVMV